MKKPGIIAGVLAALLVAAVVAGVSAAGPNCTDSIPEFASGENPEGIAGQLYSNPLEKLLIRGYTIVSGSTREGELVLEARTLWCIPYSRARVSESGATRI